MSKVLTLQEAAEVLRLSERTVGEKARSGELPGVRIGRQWRFNADELQRLITPSARPAPVPAATVAG